MFNINIENEPYRIKFYHGPSTTEAQLIHLDYDIRVSQGVAECHPNDQFCKATGRKVALAKALQNWTEDRWTRKLVWDKYFEKSPRSKI